MSKPQLYRLQTTYIRIIWRRRQTTAIRKVNFKPCDKSINCCIAETIKHERTLKHIKQKQSNEQSMTQLSTTKTVLEVDLLHYILALRNSMKWHASYTFKNSDKTETRGQRHLAKAAPDDPMHTAHGVHCVRLPAP